MIRANRGAWHIRYQKSCSWLFALAANDDLKGALVSVDAIATNPTIATAIRGAKVDYLHLDVNLDRGLLDQRSRRR